MKLYKYSIAVVASLAALVLVNVFGMIVTNPFILYPACFLYGWFLLAPFARMMFEWAGK